jgi:hypothetical protein
MPPAQRPNTHLRHNLLFPHHVHPSNLPLPSPHHRIAQLTAPLSTVVLSNQNGRYQSESRRLQTAWVCSDGASCIQQHKKPRHMDGDALPISCMHDNMKASARRWLRGDPVMIRCVV